MRLFILIFALSFASICGASQNLEDHFSHLPSGGRTSLHGMVLFGSGKYFLEHIPMLTPPHDFQIIAEVQLTDSFGKPVAADFSKSGFTLQPSASFSLNDYVAGRLKKFSGSVHRGSFEMGGEVVAGLERVSVSVVKYQVIRSLPAESKDAVIRLSDSVNTFESNVIRPEKSVQRIVNTSTGTQLWCVIGPDFFNNCR